jgi:hypothetical protein
MHDDASPAAAASSLRAAFFLLAFRAAFCKRATRLATGQHAANTSSGAGPPRMPRPSSASLPSTASVITNATAAACRCPLTGASSLAGPTASAAPHPASPSPDPTSRAHGNAPPHQPPPAPAPYQAKQPPPAIAAQSANACTQVHPPQRPPSAAGPAPEPSGSPSGRLHTGSSTLTDNPLNIRLAVTDSTQNRDFLQQPAPDQVLHRPRRARQLRSRLRRLQQTVGSAYTGPVYAGDDAGNDATGLHNRARSATQHQGARPLALVC